MPPIFRPQGQQCLLPDRIQKLFPDYTDPTYQTDITPSPGDLCFVAADGHTFYGHYSPTPDGRTLFTRPDRSIECEKFRVIGVVRTECIWEIV